MGGCLCHQSHRGELVGSELGLLCSARTARPMQEGAASGNRKGCTQKEITEDDDGEKESYVYMTTGCYRGRKLKDMYD